MTIEFMDQKVYLKVNNKFHKYIQLLYIIFLIDGLTLLGTFGDPKRSNILSEEELNNYVLLLFYCI